MFACPHEGCGAICSRLQELVRHIRQIHFFSRMQFPCPVMDCREQFRNGETFRKHVMYRHPVEIQEGTIPGSSEVADILEDVDHGLEVALDGNIEQVERVSSGSVFDSAMMSFRSQTAQFRLYLEHHFNLPTAVAHGIFEHAIQFSLDMQKQFSDVTKLRLKEINVEDKQLNSFLYSKDLTRVCKAPFKGDAATLKSLGYVEPKTYDLYELAGITPPRHVQKRPVMHYIPILETLKQYLSHEDVLRSVLRESHDVGNGHFSSFTSGSLFRDHPLFSQDRQAIRIHLYSDEVELCNPLGGNIKKHKICCVYFQVGNIGLKNLSALESIHAALFVRWPLVLKFKYEVVLKPLLEDLKTLSDEGIVVKVKTGGLHHFRGAVAVFSGDNLTMHTIGGFQKSFRSGKVCRFCMADYKELSQLDSEGVCTLRDPISHANLVRLVSEDDSLCSVYGVSGPSVLSEIPFIKIPFSMPPDPMHDILEKIMCLNIKSVLKGLQKTRVLQYESVKGIYKNFNQFHSIDNVNKHPGLPDNLRKKSTIKGSASQKWHLFHFFSIVVGPHVPVGNKYWELHLLALRICDIVLAVVISQDMVCELACLVTEHHKLWVKLVKGCYPPKLHYLLHYAQYILKAGPLRHVWCLRFEAYHQYIKEMARKCRNFIDITQTISRRVQMKRCLELCGENCLLPSICVKSKQKSVSLNLTPRVVQDYFSYSHFGPVPSMLASASELSINGLVLKRGCYNVVDIHDGDPSFIKVDRIFYIDNTVLVYGQHLLPITFNEHFHAFEIPNEGEGEPVCLNGSQLLPAQTLMSYNIKMGNSTKTFIKIGNEVPSGAETSRRMTLDPELPTFQSLLGAFYEAYPEAPQDEHYIIHEEDADFGVGCFVEVLDYSLLSDKAKLKFIRNAPSEPDDTIVRSRPSQATEDRESAESENEDELGALSASY